MVTRRPDRPEGGVDLARYTRCAQASTGRVIGQYSTSFGLATRLFAAGTRTHVRNIYGLVRIADEIVDGAASQAGVDLRRQRAMLDALEEDTTTAIAAGYSANLVVHAFAATARAAGFDGGLTAPFFASMRRDLDLSPMRADEIDDYIYGSAEVVGLMCLKVFLLGETVSKKRLARLTDGARRLGAAFQKINFLRDLATDWGDLGRNYFPALDPDHLSDRDKNNALDDIDRDLAIAERAIPALPDSSRAAVRAAHDLFAALSARLRATPAPRLLRTRVSVPNRHKARIFLGALAGRLMRGRR